MRLEITNEAEVSGWPRSAARIIGILGALAIPFALYDLDLTALAALVPFTAIMLMAGFKGVSIVDSIIPSYRPPRRPDVDAALLDGAPDDVRALVRDGKVLDAIRVYRQHTGVSLTAGKAVVDGLLWRAMEERVRAALADVPSEVRDLALRNRTIDAVRIYRQHTGAALKPALEVIQFIQADEVERRARAQDPA